MFTEIAVERHVTWQPSLLGMAEPDFDPGLDGARRRFLGRGAWVDVVPGWVTGADSLFDELLDTAPVEGVRAPDVRPRGRRAPARDPGVARPTPTARAHGALPRAPLRRPPCPSISANLYRDGNDSVAWHGDRIGRERADAVVAIVSLGATRTLLLRPDGGGRSIAFPLHSGDLLVQGGTCQRTFEHCVPKRANAGPRISVMFRQRGGN